MCEFDSSSNTALTFQGPYATEEHSYRHVNNNKMSVADIELAPFVQSTSVTNSAVHGSSTLPYDGNGVSTNCNNSSNIPMASLKNNTSSTSSVPQSSTSIGVNLRVTGQCSQGGRKYMEDYFSVAYQQSENAKDLEYAFVGIYDGHGGAEAATFAKEHLMMEIINQKLFWSDSDQDVLRAIREGYIATHYAMWREQDKWPKTATGLPSTAGTTATVAFIRREKIFIGHVGDSGIVLGYQNDNENFWRSRQLTTDHKPESPEERSRIVRSGGKVVVKSGVPRVVWNRPRTAGHKGPIRRSTPVDEIPFLAVARSLGDLWSYNSARNEFVVSPDPDVKVIKINPKTFRCLIFGTDGLWNVVSPQEAVDCVYEKEAINERLQVQRGEFLAEGSQSQWTNPSKGLVEKALKTWSAKKMRADNTSVVTVILYPPGTNVQDNTLSCHTQSYGLEYTQVNAEILTHDDSTTYAELAHKYMPPEEYRNFRFDDEGTQELTMHSTDYAKYGSQEYASYQPAMIESGHDYYQSVNLPHQECEKTIEVEASVENGFDVYEESEEDGDEDDCMTDNGAKYLTSSYPCDVPPRDILNNDGISMECESLDYMNSFAESYTDSLLGAHSDEALIGDGGCISSPRSSNNDIHCNDSTSSSNSSCNSSASFHSAVYRHNSEQHHELLMEHQLYQAQCMSQEEGYSLTKLETRGEQQMRSAEASATTSTCSRGALTSKEVQAFEIFSQQTATIENAYAEDNVTAQRATYNDTSATYNDTAARRRNVWDARALKHFPTLCRFIDEHEETRLELNSLLQQEKEEEQQVAIERLEIKRHEDLQERQQNSSDIDENICAEYLEDELISETTGADSSIQINEISSSMDSPSTLEEEKEGREMDVDDLVEGGSVDAVHHIPLNNRSKSNIVLLEKIEILKDKPELVIECTPSTSNSTICTTKPTLPLQPPTTRSKLPRAKPPYPSTMKPSSAKTLINPSPSKRTQFPNVPNENQRLSLPPCSSRQLRHCTSASYATLLHQRSENRQLRSMAPPHVDYIKRTLRSRNSLSKDMKAKATLNLRRSTCLSNQYLRTAAATLLMPSVVQHQQQQHVPSQKQRPNATANTAHKTPVSHLPVGMRNATCPGRAVPNSLPSSYAINLRSRQIVPIASSVATSTSAVKVNGVDHMKQQSREKRNLRSLSAKGQGQVNNRRYNTKESNSTGSFSKTTRLQSASSSLAVPPPSPKLISATKRAPRSLLAVPTSVSSVSMCSKRSTLRSGSLSNAAAAVPFTLQTRSRGQKPMSR